MQLNVADEGITLNSKDGQDSTSISRSVRRTHSDVGGDFQIGGRVHLQDFSTHNHKHSYLRQYSSPQPLKIRPAHRIPNTTLNNSTSLHRHKRFDNFNTSNHQCL